MLPRVLVFLAVIILLLMVGKVPMVQTKVAEMSGKSVGFINDFVNKALSIAVSAMLGLVAVAIGAALPIVAVAFAVVSVAILAYTFWDNIFPQKMDGQSLGGQTVK